MWTKISSYTRLSLNSMLIHIGKMYMLSHSPHGCNSLPQFPIKTSLSRSPQWLQWHRTENYPDCAISIYNWYCILMSLVGEEWSRLGLAISSEKKRRMVTSTMNLYLPQRSPGWYCCAKAEVSDHNNVTDLVSRALYIQLHCQFINSSTTTKTFELLPRLNFDRGRLWKGMQLARGGSVTTSLVS